MPTPIFEGCLEIECPHCGQPPGSRCSRSFQSGRTAQRPHGLRVKAYFQRYSKEEIQARHGFTRPMFSPLQLSQSRRS